jgi:hypothetical protein
MVVAQARHRACAVNQQVEPGLCGINTEHADANGPVCLRCAGRLVFDGWRILRTLLRVAPPWGAGGQGERKGG